MMEQEAIRRQLECWADEKYRKFTSALLPDVDAVLGVRLPMLRTLAQQIAQDGWQTVLCNRDKTYMEEIMLRGLVIGSIKVDSEERLKYIASFIPEINCWSVCDSFCAGLKFTNRNRERVWRFLQSYLTSDKEYDLRFCVVMMLDYYINADYIGQVLQVLDQIRHDGYYVKMAVAWAVSVCFVKFPELTMNYLKKSALDDFTYNKSLQKITESLRVSKEMKEQIRSMKRK